MNRFAGPQCCALQPLIDVWPDDVSVAALPAVAGYGAGGGAFNNWRDPLLSSGLIDYPVHGRVVALPVLFSGASE